MQISFASFLYIDTLKKGENKIAICRKTVKDVRLWHQGQKCD